MNIKKYRPLLTVLLLVSSFLCFGQNKAIHSIDSSYFDHIYSLSSSRLIEDKSTGKIYTTGNFVASDTGGGIHLPFYIHQLTNNNTNNFTYIEDASGFVIYGFKNNATCIKNNYFYYAGTLNDNKTICKTDLNGNIIWNKRQGHHSFTDMLYHNGNLVLTGQDENSIGEHSLLISIIDTAGTLLNSKNFYNPNVFFDASKVLLTNNGYLLVGSSLNNTDNKRGVLLIEVDYNLNLLWSKTIFRDGLYHSINDAKHDSTNKETLICGYVGKSNKFDSLYVLKVDDNGSSIFYNHYFRSDSSNYRATSLDIDANGNSFIGIIKEHNNQLSPLVAKLNRSGNVIWVKNYATDSLTHESISDLILDKNGDLNILGDYKYNDTSSISNIDFFTLKVDSNAGYWSCDTFHSLTKLNKTTTFMSDIKEESYLGTFLDYPFISNVKNLNTQFLTSCEDSTKNILEEIHHDNILFSNPNKNKISIFYNNNIYQYIYFELTDIQGKIILKTVSNPAFINSSSLKNGLYIINAFSNTTHIQSNKILIFK